MEKNQRTLVILKPDAVSQHLIGILLMRLEKTGAKLINMKMLKASKDQLTNHYEGVGKLLSRKGSSIFEETINYMSSGMIVPIVLEGGNIVTKIRKLCGPTCPWEAPIGTLRGDFGRKDPNLPIRNVIHASATPEEAEQEIKIWFPEI